MNWYKKARLEEEELTILDQAGHQVVDSKTLGQYELYLIEGYGSFFNLKDIPRYQLGLKREDTSFVDLQQQNQSNPPKNPNVPIKDTLEWVKNTINNWVSQYGPIAAVSHSEEKNNIYKAILNRIGINYRETTYRGQNVMVIE